MKVYLTTKFTVAWSTIRTGMAWVANRQYPKYARVQVPEVASGATYYYEYVSLKTNTLSAFPTTWGSDNKDPSGNWQWVPEDTENDTPWWYGTVTYSAGHQVNYDHTAGAGENVYYSYESLINNNTGIIPYADDGTSWLNLGPANAAAMFDDSNNTKTTVQDGAKYIDSGGTERDGAAFSLTVNGYAKAVILLGLEGADSVTIVQKNSAGTVIKSETTTDHLWKPTEVFHLTTTTWSATYSLTVYLRQPTIAAGSGQEYQPLKIGNVLVSNNIIDMGWTQWGVTPGITSYSTFDTNEWGTTTFVPRVSQRDVNGTIEVDTVNFDETFFTCENLTQSLAFYDFNNDDESDYGSLRVYGVLTSMSPNMQSGVSTIDLTVRGYV